MGHGANATPMRPPAAAERSARPMRFLGDAAFGCAHGVGATQQLQSCGIACSRADAHLQQERPTCEECAPKRARRRDSIERCVICLEGFQLPDVHKQQSAEGSVHSIAMINECQHMFHQHCWVSYVKANIRTRARAALGMVRNPCAPSACPSLSPGSSSLSTPGMRFALA